METSGEDIFTFVCLFFLFLFLSAGGGGRGENYLFVMTVVF